jgi:hypothetical protein
MSTDYALLKKVTANALFDGRLEKYRTAEMLLCGSGTA